VLLPEMMSHDGVGVNVTVLLHVLAHPFLVATTEYVPPLVTAIQRDVCP
jgi:hypothetical protein